MTGDYHLSYIKRVKKNKVTIIKIPTVQNLFITDNQDNRYFLDDANGNRVGVVRLTGYRKSNLKWFFQGYMINKQILSLTADQAKQVVQDYFDYHGDYFNQFRTN